MSGEDWQLNLNPLKCEHLCISYKRFPSIYNYNIDGQCIHLKPVIHYLGILIKSHLKWGDHVEHLSAKATRSLNYLRHTLFSCPMYIKAVAYKSLVRSVLEYASPVWCLHTLKDKSQLESVQQRAARWVCHSRWNPDSQSWSKSSASCLQELMWPSLHSILAHDILHQRISIPFNKHFQFSKTNMRSHPLSLCIPSTTIDPYHHSFL